ncbi:hypothetical protein LJR220_000533 [Bradyrhizobium sp. LjRoot220]|uniref:hypothetical protein n=1 Tax=Bradyrhizobium sp. LjRoot220 TaxID=3342284 RepID=UPI003ED08C7B
MSDEFELGYDPEEFAVYSRQQIRPSAKEIADVADQLWADPFLGHVFRRVKMDGDLIESEDQSVRRFIRDRQVGELSDRRFTDLWIATGLARRRAAGLLDDFRSKEAKAYIADRVLNSPNGSVGHVGVNTTADEIYDFAKAMLNSSEMVALFRRRLSHQDTSDDDLEIINRFTSAYKWKHCLMNRSSLVMATRIASQFARGEVSAIDDHDIVDWLRSDSRIVGLPEAK